MANTDRNKQGTDRHPPPGLQGERPRRRGGRPDSQGPSLLFIQLPLAVAQLRIARIVTRPHRSGACWRLRLNPMSRGRTAFPRRSNSSIPSASPRSTPTSTSARNFPRVPIANLQPGGSYAVRRRDSQPQLGRPLHSFAVSRAQCHAEQCTIGYTITTHLRSQHYPPGDDEQPHRLQARTAFDLRQRRIHLGHHQESQCVWCRAP